MFWGASTRWSLAAVIGFVLAAYFGRYVYTNQRLTSRYQETSCTIVASGVEPAGFLDRDTMRAVVRYRYEVGGEPYAGNRIHMTRRALGSASAMRKLVARYPVGSSVRCFHDPAHPERAVLDRGIPRGQAAWMALGLAIMAFAVHRFFVIMTPMGQRQVLWPEDG